MSWIGKWRSSASNDCSIETLRKEFEKLAAQVPSTDALENCKHQFKTLVGMMDTILHHGGSTYQFLMERGDAPTTSHEFDSAMHPEVRHPIATNPEAHYRQALNAAASDDPAGLHAALTQEQAWSNAVDGVADAFSAFIESYKLAIRHYTNGQARSAFETQLRNHLNAIVASSGADTLRPLIEQIQR